MTMEQTSLAATYQGWDIYQQHLTKAVAPLTLEQLALRAAPHLRSIGELTTHIIGARARWFHRLMGEGGPQMADLMAWDRPVMTERTAAELASGLEATWQVMQDCLSRWTTADLEATFTGTYQGESFTLTRQWVLWHLIEHDLHHGGELSFSLGMYGLAAPDL